MVKTKKIVWYECQTCKIRIALPGLVYHAEDGLPICQQCGRGVVRRVKKVKPEKIPKTKIETETISEEE